MKEKTHCSRGGVGAVLRAVGVDVASEARVLILKALGQAQTKTHRAVAPLLPSFAHFVSWYPSQHINTTDAFERPVISNDARTRILEMGCFDYRY